MHMNDHAHAFAAPCIALAGTKISSPRTRRHSSLGLESWTRHSILHSRLALLPPYLPAYLPAFLPFSLPSLPPSSLPLPSSPFLSSSPSAPPSAPHPFLLCPRPRHKGHIARRRRHSTLACLVQWSLEPKLTWFRLLLSSGAPKRILRVSLFLLPVSAHVGVYDYPQHQRDHQLVTRVCACHASPRPACRWLGSRREQTFPTQVLCGSFRPGLQDAGDAGPSICALPPCQTAEAMTAYNSTAVCLTFDGIRVLLQKPNIEVRDFLAAPPAVQLSLSTHAR